MKIRSQNIDARILQQELLIELEITIATQTQRLHDIDDQRRSAHAHLEALNHALAELRLQKWANHLIRTTPTGNILDPIHDGTEPYGEHPENV